MSVLWLAILGCVDIGVLQRDFTEAERLFEESTFANAVDCNPVEVAMMEAHLEFARVEFDQGDPRRAREHVDIALGNGKVVASTQCLPPDQDGDGIPDVDDDCRFEPEDFDGVADDDGCPDIVVDQDDDGILDVDDECVDQPEDKDGFDDEDGCPDPDNDGDGVLDVDDACPDQNGPAPEGCPLTVKVRKDTDGDGVLDENDVCPTESGPKPQGCPLDTDKDGIVDALDKCPAQPETMNQYFDEDGCPDQKPQKVKIANKQIVIDEKIQFQTGKAVLLPASDDILNQVVMVMRDYPKVEVRIEGHTDSDGSEGANQSLSKARADAVFEYLLEAGIDAGRMETQGFGEARPIDTNRTTEGKANNRRVEFHITKGLE